MAPKKRLNLNPWWKGLVIKAEIASGSYSHSQGYSSNMLQLRSLIFHILCVWWVCVNNTTRVHSALGSPCTIEIITIFRICLKKSDITSTCLGLQAPCMSNIDRNNWRKPKIESTWFPWKTKNRSALFPPRSFRFLYGNIIWPIYSYPGPPAALSRAEALTLAKQHLKTCVVSRGDDTQRLHIVRLKL